MAAPDAFSEFTPPPAETAAQNAENLTEQRWSHVNETLEYLETSGKKDIASGIRKAAELLGEGNPEQELGAFEILVKTIPRFEVDTPELVPKSAAGESDAEDLK